MMERDHVMRCYGNKYYWNTRHNETVIGFVGVLHKNYEATAINV